MLSIYHVGLEKHIATMYEEWVDEFALKKSNAEAMQLQQQKAGWLSQDLAKLRAAGREKDASLAAFKRELGNIVSAMLVGKELEEAVRALYKKFVRGEHAHHSTADADGHHSGGGNDKGGVKVSAKAAEVINELVHGNHHGRTNHNANHHGHPVDNLNNTLDDQSFLSTDSLGHGNHYGGNHNAHNKASGAQHHTTGHTGGGGGNSQHNHASLVREVDDALVGTAKEAERQKRFVERQSRNLKHRLQVTERESHSSARHRLHENSDLLFECNDLRVENKELQRKIGLLKHDLETAHRAMHELKTNGNNTQNSSFNHCHVMDGESNSNNMNDVDLEMMLQQQAQLAPWVVHDMLPAAHQTLGNNNTEQQPGQLAGANSAPNLMGIGRAVVPGGNNTNQQSMPALPPKRGGGAATAANTANVSITSNSNKNLKKGMTNANSAVSLSLPRATLTGGIAGGETMAEKRAERMAAAVEDLALQLDEAQREREMQRLELARLRKQLLNQSQVQQLPSLQQNSAGSTASLLMVSNHHGGNINSGHGSLSDGQSGRLIGANPTLTSADLTGRPNDADKASLRLGPASITNKGSGTKSGPNSRGTNKIARVGSGSSGDKYKGTIGDAEREELQDTFSLHSMGKDGSLTSGRQKFSEE